MLKSVKTLRPQYWMNNPVMQALNKDAQSALYVGGCVRNMLLGEEVDDIDIASVYTPDQVQEILNKVGIKTIPTGIDHGTITAIADDKSYEITTLRKDVETDGRHAVVKFSQDWTEDARRRDFTMNTLLADDDGNIYDPLGQGLNDLENREIVFVGNPAERIAEDYLRILRFFRFHALYGKGEMDAQSLKACKKAADKIPSLSKERISQEFFKILVSGRAVSILEKMFENNVLREFSSAGYERDFMTHFCEFQSRYGLTSLASRIFVLAGLNKTNINRFEDFLLIPKVFHKDIEAISKVLNMSDLDNDHSVKVAIYKYGRVPTAQALMIELAQDRVMNGYAPKAIDFIQNWDVPIFPVSGEDLIEEGYKPGPELGQKLAELEEEWLKRL